jgi:hypothetical protein
VPPVRGLFIKIKDSLQGIDTVRSLTARVAAKANDVGALCKLGAKLMNRHLTMDKSKQLFNQLLKLDPQGRQGQFNPDWVTGKVTYTEYAEYALAYLAALKPTQDSKPLVAFLIKYPRSPLGVLAQRALIPFLNN